MSKSKQIASKAQGQLPAPAPVLAPAITPPPSPAPAADKIKGLLADLAACTDRKKQKGIRRALRAAGHFGGKQVKSSKYFDAKRKALLTEKLALRAKRLAAAAQA